MNKKKIILSLTGILAGMILLVGVAFAADTTNNPEPTEVTPISLPIAAEDGVGLTIAQQIDTEGELVKHQVQIPQIYGLKDAAFQEQLNKDLMDCILKDVQEVRAQAEEYKAVAEKQGRKYWPFEIFVDFELKSADKVLSFVVNTYMYTGGANGITRVDTYNIDTEKCVTIGLEDLFKTATDYKAVINNQILSQMQAQEEDENVLYFKGENGFKTISAEQDFYIQDENLVIVFQKYEVAPGAMGTPEFKIPLTNLSSLLQDKRQERYVSFTGVVKEIAVSEKNKTLKLEAANGTPAYFIISNDTYIINNAEITKGSTVIGFYDANRPMIMIYPPRYSVDVVGIVNEGENIKVDRFDKNLISSDGMLKLNLAKETEIILQDGASFEGELANKKLVVIYGPSTKSIPAQATPTKVVVLPEEKITPIPEAQDIPNMAIIVNKNNIQTAKAYSNKEGVIMVSLRPVSKALGLEIEWDNETKSVEFDNRISLIVGKDSYSQEKKAEFKLGAAPELKDNMLFVPLDFFKEVVGISNTFVSEDQIVIDSDGIRK